MQRRTRILYITPSYLPTIGGLERVVELLASSWAHETASVVILCRGQRLSLSGVVVDRSPSVSAWLRWSDVTVVSNSTLRYLWPCARYSRKVILQHHSDYSAIRSYPVLKRLIVRGLRRSWIKASRNIAVSGWVQEEVARRGEVWLTIANPIEGPVAADPTPAKTLDVLFVGRFVEDKGVDTLLEALMGVEIPISARFVGVGPLEAAIRRFAGSNGHAVTVSGVGAVHGGRAVREVMATARVVVVPSRYEPFGLVAAEAITAGTRVVASATGGLRGYRPCLVRYVPAEDSVALGEAILAELAADSKTCDSHRVDVGRLHAPATVAKGYLNAFREWGLVP